MMRSGLTRTPAMSLSSLSSATSFIVRVTSTVTNSVTCGAVNALPTIACAMALRTPLTGMRVSRAESEPTTAAGASGAVCAGAGAVAGAVEAGAAAAWTSSRVMMPSLPVGTTVARSMPRSLASLRTGGLASGRPPSGAPACAGTAAGACAPCPFSSACTAAATAAASGAADAPLRGRRLVDVSATP
ncbi:hypothetical protein SGRI78S_06740 [Streptomyces griseus subsp. griseus]